MLPLPSSHTFAAPSSLAILAVLGGLVAQVAPSQPPPLIRWQRTLDDALALARLKNLPLLVVANQDGELACDSLVRNRYRNKAFAGLANRYVAVIGSADRHNQQDYDDRGRRIACPRFGCVTCGEHIAIEPHLYTKYFKGQRVAPRHIGIGTDGKEQFDRYLDVGLHKIDESLRENADQKAPLPTLVSSSQSLSGLAKSHAHTDRVVLETRFAAAKPAVRLKTLTAVGKSGIRHPDLLRLGLLSGQAAVVRAAEEILAKTATKADLDLLLRTLGTARSDDSYARVMQGLEHAAKTDDICRRALTIRRALNATSSTIDPGWWRNLYQEHQGILTTRDLVPNEELEDLDARIDHHTEQARKADPNGKHSLAIARDTIRYGLNRIQNSKDPTFLLQDAKGAIERAEKNGAPIAATAVCRTRIHWLLNELDEAGKSAELAIQNAGKRQSPLHLAPTSQQTAAILEIYARCQMRIVQSPNLGPAYPAAALTEAHRAWQALAAHPLCSEAQHKAHHDLLLYVGTRRIAGQTVRQAIQHLPASSLLHEAFREQALWEGGWPGLSTAYRAVLRTGSSNSVVDWFEGYASLLAAEGYVRHSIGKDPGPVYRQAIGSFKRSADGNSNYQRSADHYAAICHGGRAKLALDKGAHAAAVDALLDGVKLSPATYPLTDGLQNTMKRTTRRLRRRIAKNASLLKKLDRGLRAAGIEPGG